jgi:hypothetical protein
VEGAGLVKVDLPIDIFINSILDEEICVVRTIAGLVDHIIFVGEVGRVRPLDDSDPIPPSVQDWRRGRFGRRVHVNDEISQVHHVVMVRDPDMAMKNESERGSI